jgi:peptidoglycan/xylan/chitin deacetylase (PgdA/CDA1 family)
VLLEAAAMGKPAVATDVPGCREVVADGENGLLVPPRDAKALADSVARLIGDDVLRGNMGTAGRQRMEDHFDEREVVAQTMGIYSDMLGRKPDEEPQKGTGPICAKHPAGRAGKSNLSPSAALDKGVFTISLDFELAWGTRGRPAASRVGPYLDGTRDAIWRLLGLFEQYEIPATWAVVGSLLMGGTGTTRRHPLLSGEEFSDIPAGDATTAPRWYAEDIVERLLDHPADQEIACHSLTHRFADPTESGKESFRRELRQFRQLFEERYLEQPTSFIYPKAKMAHFDVLVEEGFRCIRGPEDKWFESLPGTLLPAGFRMLDAKLAVSPKVRLPRQIPEGLWVLPSSQFYSPLMSVGRHVSVSARVRKATKGLRQATRLKRLYHLWTHPFNLGMRTDELLGGFEQILQEACRLRESDKLEILTMRELTARLGRSGNADTSLQATKEKEEGISTRKS